MASYQVFQDPDKTYPTFIEIYYMLSLKGLSFAALTAAIIASYLVKQTVLLPTLLCRYVTRKPLIPNLDEGRLVNVGKITVIVSMLLAVVLSLIFGDALMSEEKQGFYEYIQEYTGFVSQGILYHVYLMGLLSTEKNNFKCSTLFATVGGFITSVILKFLPRMGRFSSFTTDYG